MELLCKKCNRWQDKSVYGKSMFHHRVCWECRKIKDTKEYQRTSWEKWYAKNREKRLVYAKEYYQKTKLSP